MKNFAINSNIDFTKKHVPSVTQLNDLNPKTFGLQQPSTASFLPSFNACGNNASQILQSSTFGASISRTNNNGSVTFGAGILQHTNSGTAAVGTSLGLRF